MAYPNYAITRIEEYLAALADGSASEKAILASAIEEGGLGWIEPAQVLYETDAATEEISLTAPIIELTEGDSLTLSFTLGSNPAVEATATVTDVDDVLTAAFELSQSQTVTITDETITFSTDPDGAAFTITQPAVVHMIDSKFLPSSGDVVVINATASVFDDPLSFNDISAAVQAGQIVLVINKKNPISTEYWYLYKTAINSDVETPYQVEFDGGNVTYVASSADAPLTRLG